MSIPSLRLLVRITTCVVLSPVRRLSSQEVVWIPARLPFCALYVDDCEIEYVVAVLSSRCRCRVLWPAHSPLSTHTCSSAVCHRAASYTDSGNVATSQSVWPAGLCTPLDVSFEGMLDGRAFGLVPKSETCPSKSACY